MIKTKGSFVLVSQGQRTALLGRLWKMQRSLMRQVLLLLKLTLTLKDARQLSPLDASGASVALFLL